MGASGTGRLEMREITEKIGSLGKDQGVDFFARVEFNMNLADRDLTGDLDFYQFCYMSFLTCLDGSYRSLSLNLPTPYTLNLKP